jgi:hypothetical protein
MVFLSWVRQILFWIYSIFKMTTAVNKWKGGFFICFNTLEKKPKN